MAVSLGDTADPFLGRPAPAAARNVAAREAAGPRAGSAERPRFTLPTADEDRSTASRAAADDRAAAPDSARKPSRVTDDDRRPEPVPDRREPPARDAAARGPEREGTKAGADRPDGDETERGRVEPEGSGEREAGEAGTEQPSEALAAEAPPPTFDFGFPSPTTPLPTQAPVAASTATTGSHAGEAAQDAIGESDSGKDAGPADAGRTAVPPSTEAVKTGFEAMVPGAAAAGGGGASVAQAMASPASGTVVAAAAAAAPPEVAAPAQAPQPLLAPVPLGAVPMTIGLRALGGSNRFEIRLDPADLGRIDVSLDIGKDNGVVTAHLVVDRVETLALLQRDAGALQQALSQTGLEAGEASINLSLRSGTDPGGQGGDRGSEPRRGGPGTAEPADTRAAVEAAPLRVLRGPAGIDIRI